MLYRSLDEVIQEIRDAWNARDIDLMRIHVIVAEELFPDELETREWQAILAIEEEQFSEAMAYLDDVLAKDPDRTFAALQRVLVLDKLWMFREERDQILAILKSPHSDIDEDEESDLRFSLGRVLENLGDLVGSEREFRQAALLMPERYRMPLRLSRTEFEEMIRMALDTLPGPILELLDQVAVVAGDYPPRSAPDPQCLGLYTGIPRTERSHDEKGHLDTIHIFQRTHELLCLDRQGIQEQVRKTVVHELAHHFGLGEEDMGEYA